LLGIKELDTIVEKLNRIVEKRRGVPEEQYADTNL